jgi:DNA-directed RNA polymerase subunit beta (EC 2.7.7.6)
MARTIRERMNVRDSEQFNPIDLINAKTLSSVINSFFGTSQLSQFMDQTNPLARLRTSAVSAPWVPAVCPVTAPASRS